MVAGEEKAWETLAGLDPQDVCRRAGVSFDSSSGAYSMLSFALEIRISTSDRQISSQSAGGTFLLEKLRYFSRLSMLRYLIDARDIPHSGVLVRPADMKKAQIYFEGSHVLPLGRIAGKYGRDAEGFLKRGMELGDRKTQLGDVSVELHPFPRIPASILLWKEDEEFPARCDILFDSTCELQLPTDIIWATGMMCVLMML